MKKLTTLFLFLFSTYSFSQDYYTVANVISGTKPFEIQAKLDANTFTLKIVDINNSSADGLNYNYDVDKTVLSEGIQAVITKIDSDSTTATPAQKTIFEGVLDKIKLKKEALKSTLQKTTETIDGDPIQYSGAITLNTSVKLSKDDRKKCNGQMQNLVAEDDVLKINKAYINFFNNKASTIVLEGTVNNDPNEKVTVVNNSFSIPIRYFNNYGSTNTFSTGKNKCYKFDYNDVFSYDSDQHFNYSIANDELHFTKDTLVRPVQQRRFFDFFTAVLYTDVMAFDNNNSNSLVNAQAKLLLPLNQKNSLLWGANYTLFRQLLAEANLALYNGSNDTFRTIEITKTTTPSGTTNSSFNHFDLLTKNNINGSLTVDILSHEAKRFFSYLSLGYQGAFYRTALKVSTVNSGSGDEAKDDENISSLISTSHGPYLNVEIRPQTNFGADVSVSLNNLSYNGSSTIDDINIRQSMQDSGVRHFAFRYNVVNIKADFYWLTNPKKGKKGGIFARLGAFYHTQNYEIHPQFMVGYATNLTSFVNKFSAKNKDSE